MKKGKKMPCGIGPGDVVYLTARFTFYHLFSTNIWHPMVPGIVCMWTDPLLAGQILVAR